MSQQLADPQTEIQEPAEKQTAFFLRKPSRDAPAKKECGETLYPYKTIFRHIEAKGVGYDQGYSTFGMFFTPPPSLQSNWIPFIDARLHIFNDGKPAVNTGLGVRYKGCRTYGGYIYYDYRKTKRASYNQVSAGFETLGEFFDFRINGYLPVKDTESHYFDVKFDSFQGNLLFLSTKKQFSMKGANAEFGFHAWKNDFVDFYGAFGPYYFGGKGKNAIGGAGRIKAAFWNVLTLQVSGSGDPVFHGIVQGEVGLVIPFGRAGKVQPKCNRSCLRESDFQRSAAQPPERNEIIVVDDKKFRLPAIDPATGLPYDIWFVNNLSSSLGTFESPFNTLAAAESASGTHDIIYVYPGNGTSTGMNGGIALKNSQRFFGAGMNHNLATTLGQITLPAQASSAPLITDTIGTTRVVGAASHNEIAGFHIAANGFGAIHCDSIDGTYIHNNTIDLSGANINPPVSIGVRLTSCSGDLIVANNAINYLSTVGRYFGVQIRSTASAANYRFSSNSFVGSIGSPSTGIELGVGNPPAEIGDFRSIAIENNFFSGLGVQGFSGKGIGGRGFSGSGLLAISGNLFSQMTNGGASPGGIIFLRAHTGSTVVARINDNQWVNTQNLNEQAVRVETVTPASAICVQLTNNSSDSTPSAYVLDNTAGGSFTADVFGNTGPVTTTGSVIFDTCD